VSQQHETERQPLTLSAEARVDQLCDDFETAWKGGQQPRLEDYLDAVVGPEREALVRELRRVDLHYRSGCRE
jgi:hypothetical protein